ncbi:MAG: hypothetical protein O9267_13910 [Flavobacterium sp.]|nr:hypothetical protein [Flavobacterium sp.]
MEAKNINLKLNEKYALVNRNEISPSTELRTGYEANKELMLGILGLGAIFVQVNEIMI